VCVQKRGQEGHKVEEWEFHLLSFKYLFANPVQAVVAHPWYMESLSFIQSKLFSHSMHVKEPSRYGNNGERTFNNGCISPYTLVSKIVYIEILIYMPYFLTLDYIYKMQNNLLDINEDASCFQDVVDNNW
jgi:hypothetical protein